MDGHGQGHKLLRRCLRPPYFISWSEIFTTSASLAKEEPTRVAEHCHLLTMTGRLCRLWASFFKVFMGVDKFLAGLYKVLLRFFLVKPYKNL